jgi:hypothetical protein
MFEEFLDNVVAENVLRQLQAIALDFPEHLLFLVAVGRLQLLLKETGTILVAAKLNDMTIDVLISSITSQKQGDGK